MDAYRNITSLRAIRHFTDQPLPPDSLRRILEAGRWTGSAKNTQPWHFIVVQDRHNLNQLAACGRYASHLRGAAVGVVIVTEPDGFGGFDAGRVSQNMMLAAWADGIGSCIATLHDQLCARTILGLPAEKAAWTAISFGYPDPDDPQTIEGQPRQQVLARLGRRDLDEIVHWEKWT
jgi:nitroreductase